MFSYQNILLGIKLFTHKEDHTSWHRWEKSLCFALIFGKVCLLLKDWNIASGFDWRVYVDRVALPLYQSLFADLTSFYGYHPPFAFLFAKVPMLLGFSALQGVQLLSFFSSVATFFLLRALLQHMQWLNQPAQIAFLYIASAIPLQVFLTTGATMDSILLPLAAAILYFSLRLFVPGKDSSLTSYMRYEIALCIIALCTVALLTKFNGLLLLTIPPIVGFFMSTKSDLRVRMNNVGFAVLTALIAMAIVFPYYSHRYYQTSGKFFPSNNDYIASIGLHQAANRLQRDEAGLRFFTNMLRPNKFDVEKHPDWRDAQEPRLIDTWKDVWRADSALGQMSAKTRSVTIWYLVVMPWLVGGGVILFLLNGLHQGRSMWWRFGIVLLIFSFIEIAALIKHTYDYPWIGFNPLKASYIAPVLLIFAYFLSQFFSVVNVLLGQTPLSRHIQSVGLLVVGSFVLINYLLPVY